MKGFLSTGALAGMAGAAALLVAWRLARRPSGSGSSWGFQSLASSLFKPYSLKAQEVGMNLDVLKYLTDHSVGDLAIAEYERIRKDTKEALPVWSRMLSSADEGALLHIFAKLAASAKNPKIIEVGVFTGYGTLCFASAIKDIPGAKVIGLDVNDTHIKSISEKHWESAGVRNIIEIKIGDAKKYFAEMLKSPENENSVDLVFIDADKSSYDAYYEASIKLLRPGGLILVDNVLWKGKVLDPAKFNDADTLAICALNDKIAADSRVDKVMLGISDGLFVCRKR